MEKFKGLYRIPSAWWQAWDYCWDAACFMTACTKNREHYFGEIRRQKMMLSPVGVIADLIWYETLQHARNITPGEFVVMPNHIYKILIYRGIWTRTNPRLANGDFKIRARIQFRPL